MFSSNALPRTQLPPEQEEWTRGMFFLSHSCGMLWDRSMCCISVGTPPPPPSPKRSGAQAFEEREVM